MSNEMSPEDVKRITSDPSSATLGELLLLAKTMNAGTMTHIGRDKNERPVYLVLVALGATAARLAPKIERLTDAESEPARKRRRAPAAPVAAPPKDHEGKE